jgi:RHS repeat-associated protein
VRFLTDSTGAVSDTYDYDAFGNLINSVGTTPNNYLFAGEQFDPDINLYYNCARYLDVRRGRFWGMDTDEGDDHEPLSLHKYLYASANPVNNIDPSGHDDFDMASIGTSESMSETLYSMAQPQSCHYSWIIVAAYQGAVIFGHVAIGVDGGTMWGLDPKEEFINFPIIVAGESVPAVVDPAGTGSFAQTDSVTIPSTSAQAQLVNWYIDSSIKSPGSYNAYGRNCARFVEGALSFADIASINDLLPHDLMHDLHAIYDHQN